VRITILEESRRRKSQLREILEEKGHSVAAFSSSGEFMESVEQTAPDRLFINVDAWLHGRNMFNYFRFATKIAAIPVSFYNAPENFTALPERQHTSDDKVFGRQVDVHEIAGAC
jgi:two-component SAPR family response regulator